MAERWVPNARNRFLLALIDAVARLGSSRGAHKADLPPREVRRILVVELWNIGDIVLTLPFLKRLKELFPQVTVTMLARPHAKEILRGSNLVDDFVETDLTWRSGGERMSAAKLLEFTRVAHEIRRRRFDVVFKARMHAREHFLLGLSGARRTVAHSLGAGDTLLTDALLRGDPEQHKTDDWLDLLAPFGGSREGTAAKLQITPEEENWADAFLAERNISVGDTLIGLHCGASLRMKRWPSERFAEVARALVRRPGIKVLVFADEQGSGSDVAAVKGVVAAKVGLRQMMALIQRCRVIVCNDSGPMHIAGALGVPVVAIFGSGIPRWFAPLGDGHQLLEGGSSPGNLVARGGGVNAIAVADVLAAVEKAMAP